MNFEEITQEVNRVHKALQKMNIESLNLFAEVHQLRPEQFKYNTDTKLAQNLLYYLYYNKLCALNAINLPEKITIRLTKLLKEYNDSTKMQIKIIDDVNKRGARAALIKQMLLAGKSRMEIKLAVLEHFPDTPHNNIGCQIAATICFLKKKGALNVISNKML